jgi:hypothetical protein
MFEQGLRGKQVADAAGIGACDKPGTGLTGIYAHGSGAEMAGRLSWFSCLPVPVAHARNARVPLKLGS